MGMLRSEYCFVLLLCAASVSESLIPGSEECRELGFSGALMCPSCDQLADTIGAEDSLIGECRGCCTEIAVTQRMAHARLEVCK